ncbi:FmdB family zinc ribbon protein [Anaeromyxobacter terrae]|uniref:FmdB family zinc ribbon protein n=1 Tax=Anaeromyxobacter terrae TaxID=2925406 RepID=UPI001F59FFC7|nr:zinc ribbon domain-containing protein [Anaeromyxobacter sp. SG22]
MPIYEYVCEACGRLTEVMQRMTDPAPACPECGAPKLARLISRTSFQLKGGGWYSDLYSSPKTKPGAESTGPASKPAGDTTQAPAAKADVAGNAAAPAKPAGKKDDA